MYIDDFQQRAQITVLIIDGMKLILPYRCGANYDFPPFFNVFSSFIRVFSFLWLWLEYFILWDITVLKKESFNQCYASEFVRILVNFICSLVLILFVTGIWKRNWPWLLIWWTATRRANKSRRRGYVDSCICDFNVGSSPSNLIWTIVLGGWYHVWPWVIIWSAYFFI